MPNIEHRTLNLERKRSRERAETEFMGNGNDEQRLRIGHLGLSLLPFFMGDFAGLVYKDEDAFLVADDNVGIFFVQDFSRDNLGADAGVVVDEMRDEVSLAFGRSNELEPIENGGTGG